MRSLSRCRKAQFFILSAFAIISIIYFISQWMEPYTIVDTSSVVLMEEPFIFNNIKEKAMETVKISKSCEDLEYNLQEYKEFVESYVSRKGKLLLGYSALSGCLDDPEEDPPFIVVVDFRLTLVSPDVKIESNFTATR